MRVSYRVRGSGLTPSVPVPQASHDIETVAGELLGILLAPVGEALQQGGVVGAVMQFQKPGRGLSVAVILIEHRAEGSNDAGAVGHCGVACELRVL